MKKSCGLVALSPAAAPPFPPRPHDFRPLRRTVRTIYAFACGYCGVTEAEVGSYLTIDHHFPQDAGGSDDLSNLVYACNTFKSAAWNPTTPPVLHPLQTDMTLHVRLLPNDTLEGLTAEGVRHIETLHLNRPPLVERRKMRRLIQALLEHEAQRIEREKRLDRENQNKRRKIQRKRKRRQD